MKIDALIERYWGVGASALLLTPIHPRSASNRCYPMLAASEERGPATNSIGR